jgi:hypothetical protein
MKRITTHMQFCLLAIIVIFTASCRKEKLSDVMSAENLPNVSLALENRIDIGNGNNFTLDNSELTVPVTINFSGTSPKAFNVQIKTNTDTIARLVQNGTLPVNTVALEEGTFTFPPVVDIAFGVNSITFNLRISRSFLEKKHGKNVAIAVKMNDPAKGNTIAPAKNSTVIVIKTADLIAADAVHYISFSNPGGNEFLVTKATNYTLGSQDISIPIPLGLSGEAGQEFTVDVVSKPDTVTTLINNGTLKNTILFDSKSYGIPNPRVRFAAGKSNATLDLTVRLVDLLAEKGKNVAIALTLKNPSKFQLSLTRKTIIVIIDPHDFSRPFNGVPFVISGAVDKASAPIYAGSYDLGGEGVAYHDDGNKDGSSVFRSPDNVDAAENSPSTAIGWTNTGEWLTYSVLVEETGEYEMNMLLGSNNSNGRYSVFFDNLNVSGILAVTSTGSYGNYQPHLSTVQLRKGRHIMKIFWDNGSHDYKGVIFTRKK